MGRKLTNNEFIERSNIVHNNKYDYSLVNYKTNKTKVNIICYKHGIFKQSPSEHLKGRGCPICTNRLLTNLEIIERSKKIHGDKYDYSLVNYINSHTKIKLICPIHGVFEQNTASHLHGCGCPICMESTGEKDIRIFLERYNIKYIRQKKFKKCKYKRQLPFDFYLPDSNICIEYDGEQHFIPIKHFGGKKRLIEQQKKRYN